MWEFNEKTGIWECEKDGVEYCFESAGKNTFWRKDKPEAKWQTNDSKEEVYRILCYEYFEEL